MSTRTSRRRKKAAPVAPTGPLTDAEMLDWGRRIQLKRMIEGGPIFGDTEDRAWLELRHYKKLPRVIVDVRKNATLYVTDKDGTRGFSTGAMTLAVLGFRPEMGKRFVILGADVTPVEQPKPKRRKR